MTYFCGFDPGKHGGVVCVSAKGDVAHAGLIPMTDMKATGKERQYDLRELWTTVRRIASLPDIRFGIENPQTRPGEGAETSRWFGEGIGYLRMAVVAAGHEPRLIAPNAWKGKLGIPGKTDPKAKDLAWGFVHRHYPAITEKHNRPSRDSGVMDAALIAHYLRIESIEGLRGMRDQFGKDSDEAFCTLFRGRSKFFRGIS